MSYDLQQVLKRFWKRQRHVLNKFEAECLHLSPGARRRFSQMFSAIDSFNDFGDFQYQAAKTDLLPQFQEYTENRDEAEGLMFCYYMLSPYEKDDFYQRICDPYPSSFSSQQDQDQDDKTPTKWFASVLVAEQRKMNIQKYHHKPNQPWASTLNQMMHELAKQPQQTRQQIKQAMIEAQQYSEVPECATDGDCRLISTLKPYLSNPRHQQLLPAFVTLLLTQNHKAQQDIRDSLDYPSRQQLLAQQMSQDGR